MKRLLLASNGGFVTEQGLNLLFDDLSEINLAHITTAQKGVDDREYIKRHQEDFKKKGIKFEDIDLDGKTPDDLREIFKDKNAIYVDGGNTFYLLKSIRESGFDIIVKELLDKGVAYFGSSAGSYVACPTIEMATWKPEEKKDRCGVTDFSAINLVSFLAFAHYADDMKSIIQEKISKSKYPVKIIRDDQAILVEDDKVTFVGEGEEVEL
ncbi:MAG: Type 1 glutamine amidotransferase-like domain-containing protein [Candidatus Moranbacteria bacterium]|nr:Type 1 glutamine amidotransferase-like domain-containing protein [Candidatus Moranbacteria bacterium]